MRRAVVALAFLATGCVQQRSRFVEQPTRVSTQRAPTGEPRFVVALARPGGRGATRLRFATASLCRVETTTTTPLVYEREARVHPMMWWLGGAALAVGAGIAARGDLKPAGGAVAVGGAFVGGSFAFASALRERRDTPPRIDTTTSDAPCRLETLRHVRVLLHHGSTSTAHEADGQGDLVVPVDATVPFSLLVDGAAARIWWEGPPLE